MTVPRRRSGGWEAVTVMESKKGSAKEDLHEGWCGGFRREEVGRIEDGG